MFPFARLLRFPNLLIVAATMALIWWCILWPSYRAAGVLTEISTAFLWKLIAATVFTTAFGNVINDLFDEPTDRLNRPDRLVVGLHFSRKTVIFVCLALLLAALGLGWLVFLESEPAASSLNLFIFPTVCAVLFIYSWLLKGTPLVGNLLVAGLCAAVPLLVFFQETRPLEVLKMHRPELAARAVDIIWTWAGFAFLTTFLREIVKDLEDFEGDWATGQRTFPALFGEKAGRWLAISQAWMLLFFLGLSAVQLARLAPGDGRFWLAATAIFTPGVLIFWQLFRARTPLDFHRISWLIKWLMLAGLAALLFYPSMIK